MGESIRNKFTGPFFMSASLVGLSIFFLFPYIDVFRRSFTVVSGLDFVGLSNYIKVLNSPAFQLAMQNSFAFIIIAIPLLLGISLFISVFLYNKTKLNMILRSSFLLPLAIPVASVVILWRLAFDASGTINNFLDKLGIEPVNWMNSKYAFTILVISYIWKNLGYNIILWIAALSTISPALYDAARIDGAGELKCFTRITIPLLTPSIFVITVLAVINSFKIFREAYLVAGDYPHESIYMIQHLFNNWLRDLSLDKMAAGATVNSAILIVFIVVLQLLWNRDD